MCSAHTRQVGKWFFLQISLTNLSARRFFVDCRTVGLYHCECHFVIREEEDELFWRGLDLEYLQEDPGRGLTGNPDSSAFNSKYLYVKYLDLIDSWNEYANLLADQFRELHEDSPQRRELYASRPPASLKSDGRVARNTRPFCSHLPISVAQLARTGASGATCAMRAD
jgi:hypothetical protein